MKSLHARFGLLIGVLFLSTGLFASRASALECDPGDPDCHAFVDALINLKGAFLGFTSTSNACMWWSIPGTLNINPIVYVPGTPDGWAGSSEAVFKFDSAGGWICSCPYNPDHTDRDDKLSQAYCCLHCTPLSASASCTDCGSGQFTVRSATDVRYDDDYDPTTPDAIAPEASVVQGTGLLTGLQDNQGNMCDAVFQINEIFKLGSLKVGDDIHIDDKTVVTNDCLDSQ